MSNRREGSTVFGTFNGLGEETLNRIATMALASQLDKVDHLDVQVKTDLELLSQGKLDSLWINGKGLIMQQDLRMQELQIKIRGIAVNPMKALMGNIQLTEPTQGMAEVRLTVTDLNRAFNSPILKCKMQGLSVEWQGQPVTLDTQDVACEFLESGRIAIATLIQIRETGDTQSVAFSAIPTVTAEGRKVLLDDIQYQEGQALSGQLTEILVEQALHILDLRNFEMDGIALQVSKIKVAPDELILRAIANVTRFPSVA